MSDWFLSVCILTSYQLRGVQSTYVNVCVAGNNKSDLSTEDT